MDTLKENSVVVFPFLIGKVLTSCVFECDSNGNVIKALFPFLIGKVLTTLHNVVKESIDKLSMFPFLIGKVLTDGIKVDCNSTNCFHSL